MSSPCIVYFCKPVGLPGPIKIGCTGKPIERVKQLMLWSPVDLELIVTAPGTFADERAVHAVFGDHHIRHEWFQPCDALVAGIESLKKGSSLKQAFDLDRPGRPVRSFTSIRRQKWSDSTKLRVKYGQRLRAAERKTGDTIAERLVVPKDVDWIIHQWRESDFVSERDLARLDEVLAEPHKHMITHAERYPRLAAVTRPATRPASPEAA